MPSKSSCKHQRSRSVCFNVYIILIYWSPLAIIARYLIPTATTELVFNFIFLTTASLPTPLCTLLINVIKPAMSLSHPPVSCVVVSCFIRVLEVLRHFSPDASVGCQSATTRNEEVELGRPVGRYDSPLTDQLIIARNKQIVETMIGILQCHCSENLYLLAVISMAIFKLIERYGAAAYRNDDLQPQPCQDSNGMTLIAVRHPSVFSDHFMVDTAIRSSERKTQQ